MVYILFSLLCLEIPIGFPSFSLYLRCPWKRNPRPGLLLSIGISLVFWKTCDATRSAQAMKDMEERLSTRMDYGFIELATSLKETIQVKQSTLAKSLNQAPESAALRTQDVFVLLHSYRLVRIDFS